MLLSGSVARGDFFPGKLGGMVDLTVFARPGDSATAESVFGPDEAPAIPYHCLKRGDTWFQIWFTKAIDREAFRSLPEARKFALLESQLLWQHRGSYTRLFRQYVEQRDRDLLAWTGPRIDYVRYLISDYKVDRWKRRGETRQLHANLNQAIVSAIGCLYYLNREYTPAEDRLFYHSYTLATKPGGYARLLDRLMSQRFDSIVDYRRREALFKRRFVSFLEDSKSA